MLRVFVMRRFKMFEFTLTFYLYKNKFLTLKFRHKKPINFCYVVLLDNILFSMMQIVLSDFHDITCITFSIVCPDLYKINLTSIQTSMDFEIELFYFTQDLLKMPKAFLFWIL